MRIISSLFALALIAYGADTLQLRDGRTLTGQFVGATRVQVWFQQDGQAETAGPAVFPVAQVVSVGFDPAGSPLGPSAELKPLAKAPLQPASILEWVARLQRNYGASFFPQPKVQYFAFTKE
jgi:hypothetical protein